MIPLKDPGSPAGTELAAIERFLLYFAVKKYNKAARGEGIINDEDNIIYVSLD